MACIELNLNLVKNSSHLRSWQTLVQNFNCPKFMVFNVMYNIKSSSCLTFLQKQQKLCGVGLFSCTFKITRVTVYQCLWVWLHVSCFVRLWVCLSVRESVPVCVSVCELFCVSMWLESMCWGSLSFLCSYANDPNFKFLLRSFCTSQVLQLVSETGSS